MLHILSTATLVLALPLAAAAVEGVRPAVGKGSSSEDAVKGVAEALALMEGAAPAARWRDAAQKAAAADPEFAFAHLLVGLSYGGGDNRKPHVEKAQALAAKAPAGQRRLIEASVIADRDAAISAFEALDKDYDDSLISIRLGQLYLERFTRGKGQESDLLKAKAALEEGATLDRKSARARLALGNVLLLRGNYSGARAELEEALPLLAAGVPPGQVRYGTAMSYLYEGKPQEAIKTLEQYVGEYRNTPNLPFPEVFIYNSIARIHLENGQPEAALASYEKGFEVVKSSTTMKEDDKKVWLGRLHHGRGRSLARLGKHKEAWAEAETVKKMIDEGGEEGKQYIPAYHYLAGYLKLESGETAAAIDHLKQADAEDPFHKLLLARAYEKAGEKEKARAAYQEVVEFKQNNIERALSYPEAKKKL